MPKRMPRAVLAFLLLFCILAGCGGGTAGENDSSMAMDTSMDVSETQSEMTQDVSSVSSEISSVLSSASVPSGNLASSAVSSSVSAATSSQTSSAFPSVPVLPDTDAAAIVAGVTLKQKVYQMFILAPESLTGQGTVTSAGDKLRSALEQYPIGGLIYFASNLVNPNQVTEMLTKTQQYAMETQGLPLFLCVDEEGGKVARIGNNSAFGVEKFPNMADIKTEDAAYNVGNTIGAYLSKYGFNVDFAPDADVLTNQSNSVIGKRSFGSDPDVVSRFALAYARGLKNNGVMATYKHFPGHGATEGDTHQGFAYTEKTYDELLKSELVPFQSAADNRIDLVMTAHISIPNVIGDDTPASLSEKAVTGILREKLGYQGLIVTDSLGMGAVTQKYPSAAAAVAAVKAGNDLLLMPVDFKAAADAVISAVQNGEISESRIDESVIRIIRAKLSLKVG